MEVVMEKEDKSAEKKARRKQRKRAGRCKYCLTQASRFLGLLLILQVSFGLLALDEQLREAPPPAATCLISTGAAFERLKLPADERVAQETSQSSSSTVILRGPTNNKSLSPDQHEQVDQVAFESVCDGWCNSLRSSSSHLPTAYWTHDRRRGALVAKHVYYDDSQRNLLGSHSARLVSPPFEPPPAYHGWRDSPLRGSCKLSFRYYQTLKNELDVILLRPKSRISSRLTAPSTCDQRIKLLPDLWTSEDIYQRAKANLKSFNMHHIIESLAEQGEEALWRSEQLTLPEDLNSAYALEFITLSQAVRSGMTKPLESQYLNGLAIANITLSPECFGLNVNSTEAERVRQLVEADSDSESSRPELLERIKDELIVVWHTHWFYILLVGIILIGLLVSMVLYLCCTYVDALRTATSVKLQESQNERRKKCLYGWLHWPIGRGRVYASAKYKHQQHQLQLQTQQENLRQFLRPLKAAFEDVEMAENPGYLGKSAAAIYQNAASNGGIAVARELQQNDVERACDSILQPYYIDRCRLTLTTPLGKGAFGRVYQGRLLCYCDKGDEEPISAGESHSIKVAVKTLTDERMSQTEFVQEAANMALVSHRNIVELIGVCFDERPLYIVMELLSGGNLKDFLLKNRDRGQSTSSLMSLAGGCGAGPPPDGAYSRLQSGSNSPVAMHPAQRLCMGDLLVFGLDIARACDYLQRRNFIHRDLAARNCLLTAAHKWPMSRWPSTGSVEAQRPRSAQGAPPSALEVGANHKVDLDQVFQSGFQNSSLVVKLADFGMTRDIYLRNYYRLGHREMPVRWMPPECLDGIATSKSDVWSFGVLLWELFSMGQLPYQHLLDNRQVIEFLKSRRHARPPSATLAPASTLDHYDQPLLVLDETELDKGSQEPPACDFELLEPPLPPPHDNTPHPVYSIMCACWAADQEKRPQFDEIANRLYCCTQMPEVLNTPLPCFLDSASRERRVVTATWQAESTRASGATTQLTQLNWGA